MYFFSNVYKDIDNMNILSDDKNIDVLFNIWKYRNQTKIYIKVELHTHTHVNI